MSASADARPLIDGLPAITRALGGYRPALLSPDDPVRRAAVAMILTPSASASDLDALFIRRAEHPHDPWSGHMAFPGGRHDPGDESLQATALRETSEEIGLALEPAAQIGRLDDLSGGRLAGVGLAVAHFVFYCPELPELVPSPEVAAIERVPLAFLADPANVRPYVYPHDPMGRKFPSFPCGEGGAIWGITYRMIRNFMGIMEIAIPGEEFLDEAE